MMIQINPARRFSGKIQVPGDKSISHRALIFGAIAEGGSEITGLLPSADVHSTARCLGQLGVKVEERAHASGSLTVVHGVGLHGLKASPKLLDCGNSGTTIRLLMGLLAGQEFASCLSGDESLQKRPMRRVADPLRKMGAKISLYRENHAPVEIEGCRGSSGERKPLVGMEHELRIASAQIKSALLLAGLYADGNTVLRGAIASRDHTERMLPYYGVKVAKEAQAIAVTGGQQPHGVALGVPGDPSSAAFWAGAACLVRGGSIEIENVLLNPTRIGFFRVLERMGARVEEEVVILEPEPVGRIFVSAPNGLKGVQVDPGEIPSLIDEIPLLAVLGSQADGETLVHGAEELRVKESDRIEAVAMNLRKLGAEIDTFHDGFRISGPQKLKGAKIDSFQDHRIAMAFAVAGLAATGATEIEDAECVGISYPDFFETLVRLVRELGNG